jgi:hypothetical protein
MNEQIEKTISELNKEVKDLNKLKEYLIDFLGSFDRVFDNDWDMTKGIITDSEILDIFVSPNATFLNPQVDDETNNWHNRGGLLENHRKLISQLKEMKILSPDLKEFY